MQGIMEKHLELRDEKVAELVHIKDWDKCIHKSIILKKRLGAIQEESSVDSSIWKYLDKRQ